MFSGQTRFSFRSFHFSLLSERFFNFAAIFVHWKNVTQVPDGVAYQKYEWRTVFSLTTLVPENPCKIPGKSAEKSRKKAGKAMGWVFQTLADFDPALSQNSLLNG